MTEAFKVLAIDDDKNNLRLLRLDLEDENYEVLTAADGVQGWEVLQQHKDDIQAILLDRMMPNMNGMEFMEKLKADDTVQRIPVIMQTAAAEKDQVLAGIRAGVYYYLTKPYDKDIMLSIVKSAVGDYAHNSAMRQELLQFKRKLYLVRDGSFEVRRIEDVKYLSTFLANLYPNPERVIFGISELIVNAIEHGNLGISYSEKTKLNKNGTWLKEIEHRLALPEYKDRKVLIKYIKNKDDITLRIIDEGNGFNWQEYMEIAPERATHSHGRGIALSKMMCFDSLEYIGCGNEVLCKIFPPAP